jgi:MFS family permease
VSERSFYGWRIVGVAFVCDFVATGFLFYSYGVLFKAVAADFGGSRLGVGAGLMVVNIVGGLAAPFLGRAIDRHSIRAFMLAGTVTSAAGFALLSQVESLWAYYAVFGIFIGLGNLAMGNLAAATLVANWFVARRGRALGIATIGVSLSGVVMPAVATWLVAHVGWRGTYQVYAVGTLLLVTPIVARFVVKRPEDMGLRPDGAPPPPADQPLADERSWRTRELLRAPSFWSLVATFGLGMFALSGVLTHMVPHVTDKGIDPYRAAGVLAVTAGFGIAGKFVFGVLVDRFDGRLAVWISLAAQLLGLVGLASAAGLPGLTAAAAVFGFGMGGMVPLSATLTGQAFGRWSYGKAMGLLRPFQVPLNAIGVPFGGWVFDVTGSYDWAFRIYGLAFLIAAISIAALRAPVAKR